LERVLRPQRVGWQITEGADEPLAIFFIETPSHILVVSKGPFQLRLGTADVPDGDTVTPPELAADAPVALFTQPIEVRLGVAGGGEFHSAIGHGVHGRL